MVLRGSGAVRGLRPGRCGRCRSLLQVASRSRCARYQNCLDGWLRRSLLHRNRRRSRSGVRWRRARAGQIAPRGAAPGNLSVEHFVAAGSARRSGVESPVASPPLCIGRACIRKGRTQSNQATGTEKSSAHFLLMPRQRSGTIRGPSARRHADWANITCADTIALAQ